MRGYKPPNRFALKNTLDMAVGYMPCWAIHGQLSWDSIEFASAFANEIWGCYAESLRIIADVQII